jgi:hypothetical protein
MRHNKLLTSFLLLGTFLIIGFGCKSINIPSLSGGVSESTDPKTAVTTAYQKLMDAKFYNSTVKTKNSQAEATSEIIYNAPDKYAFSSSLQGFKNEAIVIGNDYYLRINDGKWSKSPSEKGTSVSDLKLKMSEQTLAAMKDFELVGKESVNGKDTIAYKFKSTYGGDSSSKMWIATDSGLPLKIDTEGSYGGSSLTMSILYDFDKETKIETPKVD